MNYIPELNKYISDLLIDNNYQMTVKSTPKVIYFELTIDKKKIDSVFFIIDRNIDKKCYYKFKNGCPGGQYEMTNKMKKFLIKNLKKRGFFNTPISRY